MSKTYLLTYPDGTRLHINRKTRDHFLALNHIRPTAPCRYLFVYTEPDLSNSRQRCGGHKRTTVDSVRKVQQQYWNHLRESREDNAPGIHTEQQWLERIRFFGSRCRYCNISLSSRTLTKDHQIPLCRGGSQWAANLVPACQQCNSTKGKRTPAEWVGTNTNSCTKTAPDAILTVRSVIPF